jgi:hypothetical protein
MQRTAAFAIFLYSNEHMTDHSQGLPLPTFRNNCFPLSFRPARMQIIAPMVVRQLRGRDSCVGKPGFWAESEVEWVELHMYSARRASQHMAVDPSDGDMLSCKMVITGLSGL